MDVCPVECISAGEPVEQWPTYYVDPGTCIDCGACMLECPFSAIFPDDEVPSVFRAAGGELINRPGLTGRYESANHYGEPVVLDTTRVLSAGETVDLTPSIQENTSYYR
jgi:NAD-dependent dihydropyrimidine dehydrogenase PreA subunit